MLRGKKALRADDGMSFRMILIIQGMTAIYIIVRQQNVVTWVEGPSKTSVSRSQKEDQNSP